MSLCLLVSSPQGYIGYVVRMVEERCVSDIDCIGVVLVSVCERLGLLCLRCFSVLMAEYPAVNLIYMVMNGIII